MPILSAVVKYCVANFVLLMICIPCVILGQGKKQDSFFFHTVDRSSIRFLFPRQRF